MRLFGRILVGGLVLVAALLLLLPIVGLLWRGIRERAWTQVPAEAFWQSFLLSMLTTLISLLIILLLGSPLAYVLARGNFRGRRWLNALVELPVVMPPAVAGLALLATFGRRGLIGEHLEALGISLAFSTAAVIIAQVFVALPFYTRSAQIGFRSINPELEDAALVDGATQWGAFWYVTFPLALRAMISGALLSWARALGEFGATIVFAGRFAGTTRTLPLLVYSLLDSDIDAAIWVALILIFIAVCIVAVTRFLARDEVKDY